RHSAPVSVDPLVPASVLLIFAFALLEPERVKIGVLHHHAQTDGLTGNPADITTALPGDTALNFVADHFNGVFQRISRNWLPVFVLNLKAETARRRGCEVDDEIPAGEPERFGYQFASLIGSVYRGKSVGAQSVTAQVMRGLSVAVLDKE